MRRFVSFQLAVAVMLTLVPAALGDWPHLRSRAPDALSSAGLRLEPAWRVDVGSGYSGVVVEGDRAVTAFADGEGSDVVAAFDTETGRELWRTTLDRTYQGHSGSQDGPTATPTLAGGKVFMVSPHGAVVALALDDGAEIWRRHLVDELGGTPPVYGYASTPLVVGDVVVVQANVPERGALHGLASSDGELLWSAVEDTVGYQTPIRAELGGEPMTVAITDHFVVGLDPATGAVHWQERYAEENQEGVAQPVVVRADGKEGVLVSAWSDPSKVFGVERGDDGWTVEPWWETRGFGRTYAIAEQLAGQLFGFRGRFLHAVDPSSGEVLWRSRPPGALGLSVIGDKLVFVDGAGELVVAAGEAEEWRELARTPALEVDGFTTASYADGRLFVRNLEQMAAIEVNTTSTAGQAAPAERIPLVGELAALESRLTAADPALRPALLDQYLAGRELPVVETVGGRTWAHFLWRGEAEDVALSTAVFQRDQVPLAPVAETDLWARSVEIPDAGGGVWQYTFAVDLGDPVADPGNDRRSRTSGGERSWFSTPGWEPAPRLGPVPAEDRGRLQVVDLEAGEDEEAREVRLLLPADSQPDTAHRLLVVPDGNAALTHGLGNVVDHLAAAGEIGTVAVAFVPLASWREGGFNATESLARVLGEELFPAVSEHVRLAEGGHAVFGTDRGSTPGLVAALLHPELFSRAAVLDLMTWSESEDLLRRVIESEEGARPSVRLEWTTGGVSAPSHGRSTARDREWLPEALEAAGAGVVSEEVPGGPGYANWRHRFEEIVRWLVEG